MLPKDEIIFEKCNSTLDPAGISTESHCSTKFSPIFIWLTPILQGLYFSMEVLKYNAMKFSAGCDSSNVF